jgi:hypothetical protein
MPGRVEVGPEGIRQTSRASARRSRRPEGEAVRREALEVGRWVEDRQRAPSPARRDRPAG